MANPFHEGELEMQARAGVAQEAQAVGRIIASELSPAARRFVARQRFAVAASLDARGAVWASVLAGAAGFLSPVDGQLLWIAAQPGAGDPLADNLRARPELGLLVFDAETRQRMRLNGRATLAPEGIFLLANQVYGNCPKYIQRRRLVMGAVAPPTPPGAIRVGQRLEPRQRELVARADTFFIASHHPRGGADASHRGGFAGFVQVVDAGHVAFPDYPGNGMFNTLGNLLVDPRAGLAFVDFERGDVLQLSGEARVAPDGAVTFAIGSVRETEAACAVRFSFLEYSPANPALSRSAAAGI